MSQKDVCGRLTPRWSVATPQSGQPNDGGMTSTRGLPKNGMRVSVGPPLLRSGPRAGLPPFCVSPEPVNPHDASSEKLNPDDMVVVVERAPQLGRPPVGRATTESALASEFAPTFETIPPEFSTTVEYESVSDPAFTPPPVPGRRT
jgi:hypothetical protein